MDGLESGFGFGKLIAKPEQTDGRRREGIGTSMEKTAENFL